MRKCFWKNVTITLVTGFPGGLDGLKKIIKKTTRLLMQDTWVHSLDQEDSPGEGKGNPFQCFCLENSMDIGAWGPTIHGGHKELHMTEHL